MNNVAKGYLDALLWTSVYTYNENAELVQVEDAHLTYDEHDFDQCCISEMESFIKLFVSENADLFVEYVLAQPKAFDAESVGRHFGHDLLLTRNGEGTGFWDRGLGELGDRLTEAAKAYGSTLVDLDDDGVLIVAEG